MYTTPFSQAGESVDCNFHIQSALSEQVQFIALESQKSWTGILI